MARLYFWLVAVGVLTMMLISTPVLAVPERINYQGKLADKDGNPLTGTYNMAFYLFSSSSGGSAIWSENHPSVQVTDGIYSVQLGDLTVDLFENNELYLEVEIEGETLVPRQQLTSTAFSMKAAKSEDADTLDGKDSSEFADTVHDHSFGEITGSATDGQIPDDITINYAATSAYAYSADSATTAGSADYATTASDADTVDGYDATDFAAAGHDHDTRYYTESEVNTLVANLQSQIDSLQASVNQLTTLLQNVTRAGNDITFSGVNVHIVNATGTTDGTVNGLGNLIVGYNELRGSGDDRTGSHNIVVGKRHNYSAYGGLVVGDRNTISGIYASVSGGYNNRASGTYASVSGGDSNTASGDWSSVSGGYSNTAINADASVSGGFNNTASGVDASVSGGDGNTASGDWSSVSGGTSNTASGEYASVSGGVINEASGNGASISGGSMHIASGTTASISGGTGNKAQNIYSSVCGGQSNTASGNSASVCGGYSNTASGNSASVSGGTSNTASGNYHSVVGNAGAVYVDSTVVH
jgi:hypothetical protein